jgi:GTP-binding protein
VEIMPPLSVDEPTVTMTFQVNNSPFAGREGKFVTTRQIRDRLDKELQHNVALKVEDTGDPDKFKVSGRGELHLSVLIENMRREGFEMGVSRPEVIIKEIDGKKCEPIEELTIDLPEHLSGRAVEFVTIRKGELEKPVIPSRANFIILLSGYPVLPVVRLSRSNSTKVCRKPNQAICPRRNLFCSGISLR